MLNRIGKDIQKVLPETFKNQRNWDLSTEVDPDHIELFKQVVHFSPSYENNTYYNTHFVTNRKLIEELYDLSDGPGAARHQEEMDARQPNVLANLAIVFESNEHEQLTGYNDLLYCSLCERSHAVVRDKHLAIGTAVGALISIAHILGYKTGHYVCQNAENMWTIQHKMKLGGHPNYILGIGYGNHKVAHNRHHNDKNIKYGDWKRNPLPIIKEWE